MVTGTTPSHHELRLAAEEERGEGVLSAAHSHNYRTYDRKLKRWCLVGIL